VTDFQRNTGWCRRVESRLLLPLVGCLRAWRTSPRVGAPTKMVTNGAGGGEAGADIRQEDWHQISLEANDEV
jgi:hypothetical protein